MLNVKGEPQDEKNDLKQHTCCHNFNLVVIQQTNYAWYHTYVSNFLKKDIFSDHRDDGGHDHLLESLHFHNLGDMLMPTCNLPVSSKRNNKIYMHLYR